MSPDIKAAHLLLKEEKVWNAVRAHIDNYHASQTVETRVFSPTTYSFGEERPKVFAEAGGDSDGGVAVGNGVEVGKGVGVDTGSSTVRLFCEDGV